MKNVVHSADVPAIEQGNGKGFQLSRRRLGAAAGGEKLGCSLIELAPGKAGFPAHAHFANEEAVFVLEGEGVLRCGTEDQVLRAGDYAALKVGLPAHRIDNRGPAPLRYLAISTMIEPEVVVYPDSNKVAAMAGSPPGGDPSKRPVFDLYLRSGQVGYWEGEE